MQPLYAVDLDVAAVDEAADDVRGALLEHLAHWLSRQHPDAPSVEDFAASGFTVLPLGADLTASRDVHWSVVEGGAARALRVDLHQPLAGGARFTTRTTISTGATGPAPSSAGAVVHLRVVMGRAMTSGWLAPVPVETLRRPGIVRAVVSDRRLRSTALKQVVDGRYVKVRDPLEVPALVAAVQEPRRLPLLLVRPLDQHGRGFAARTASELSGLARVVVLGNRAVHEAFDEAATGIDVPVAGARLVWPNVTALTHPAYQRTEIEQREPQVVQELLRMLASLSIIARGRDEGWAAATRAAQRVQLERASQRVQAAQQAGDRDAEVAALRQQVATYRDEASIWQGEAEVLEVQVTSLREEAAAAASLRHEVESWKGQYFAVVQSRTSAPVVDWAEAPALDGKDAEPLLTFLQEASGGRCVFTDGAAKAWRKSMYVFPDKMRDALITLARASIEYAEHREDLRGRLVDWFLHQHGLEVALTDTGLERSGRAKFVYDGDVLEGVTHLKLRDNKHPRECGRVYFAMQDSPVRFVVHHVGIHL